jgi:hypothetical protein
MAGLLLASILGLSRPFDCVTLGLLRTATVLLGRPPRLWARDLLPILALAPVGAVNYWMFFCADSHGNWTTIPFLYPSAASFFVAFLPSLLLFAPSIAARTLPGQAGTLRLTTLLWAGYTIALVLLQPGTVWGQFIVGSALPMLILGALSMASLNPRSLILALLLLTGDAWFLLSMTLKPGPQKFPPTRVYAAARAFKVVCRPFDVSFAPESIGRWASAYSSCSPFASYATAPDYPSRLEMIGEFYGPGSAERRTGILDRFCVQHVLLPGAEAPHPTRWLGNGTPFKLAVTVSGEADPLSIYTRQAPCPAKPTTP